MENYENDSTKGVKGLTVYKKFLIVFGLSGVIMSLSQVWLGHQIYILQNRREAAAIVNQATAFLHWVSANDGVWIENPHPEFDEYLYSEKFEKNGREYNLYLKTPAHSIIELSKVPNMKGFDSSFRISSPNYRSEKNKPDEYEAAAFRHFVEMKAASKLEDAEYEDMTASHYRYAKPIIMKKVCLKCHGNPKNAPRELIEKYGKSASFGYKEGDVGGILLVKIPEHYLLLFKTHFTDVALTLAGLLLVVLINFLWFRRVITFPVRKLRRHAEKLSQRNYTESIKIDSKDEFGLLSETMNFMATDIEKHIKSVEESKEKIGKHADNLKKMNDTFEQFVPREFLGFLGHSDIVSISLGDQVQKEMAVFFSDIRDFTSLSEKMTPKDNFDFLNSYLKTVGPVINRNNGFIDKYIGDAIMALFPGSPNDAVNGAIEIQKEIDEHNKKYRSGSDRMPIRVGIGLHYGSLMLGTIGYEHHMQGTVISDAVNLGSRLESLTKVFGVGILISGTMLNHLANKEFYKYRFLGKVNVKGKDKKVPVYEIYNANAPEIIRLKDETREEFESAISLFRKEDYRTASKMFSAILKKNIEDVPASLYLEQCIKLVNPEEAKKLRKAKVTLGD